MFVTFLHDPMHYTQGYDNVTHLGSIRCFVDSGNWSPFGISLYVNTDAAINPLPGGGFYPAAWYDVASFVISFAWRSRCSFGECDKLHFCWATLPGWHVCVYACCVSGSSRNTPLGCSLRARYCSVSLVNPCVGAFVSQHCGVLLVAACFCGVRGFVKSGSAG